MPERDEGGPEGDDDDEGEDDEEAEAAFRQQMGLPEVSNPSTAARTEHGAVCISCVPVGRVPFSVALSPRGAPCQRNTSGRECLEIRVAEAALCAGCVCNRVAHTRRSK